MASPYLHGDYPGTAVFPVGPSAVFPELAQAVNHLFFADEEHPWPVLDGSGSNPAPLPTRMIEQSRPLDPR